MEYRVIRGRDRIGGTITEIFTRDNTKIWVDFGAELSVKPEESSDEEMIQLLKKEKPKAILFTHIHGDHIGLLYSIPKEIDIYMGKLAKKMLINIRETLVKVEALERVEKAKLQKELEILNSTQVKLYEDKKTDRIGNILFTPYRVDHSVPDAYMLRFEAEGKSIVHTGDFRNHGYLGENLLEGEFLRNRKIEARKVMEEYQDLNLHSCGDRPIEDFEHLDVELLLVITDNKGIMKNEKTAKSYYDTHKNAIDKAAHDSCCGILVLPENDFELRYEDVVYY